MKNLVGFIVVLFSIGFNVHADEKCVFDHILVTLPHVDYLELKNFLSLGSVREITGINWRKEFPEVKGFAMFEDKSYLEVWDQSKVDKWGYQEACRVNDKSTLEKIGKDYKSILGEFKTLAVVGRNGWGGEPQGGMFFIWQPKHIIDAKKDGVRQLLKLVKQNDKGQVNSNLIADYSRAGLELSFQKNKKVMIATDVVGAKRIAVAAPVITGNGLVALRFSRKGTDTDKIVIQTDSDGKPKMFLELGPNTGTLVLRADQYQQYSDLLK